MFSGAKKIIKRLLLGRHCPPGVYDSHHCTYRLCGFNQGKICQFSAHYILHGVSSIFIQV